MCPVRSRPLIVEVWYLGLFIDYFKCWQVPIEFFQEARYGHKKFEDKKRADHSHTQWPYDGYGPPGHLQYQYFRYKQLCKKKGDRNSEHTCQIALVMRKMSEGMLLALTYADGEEYWDITWLVAKWECLAVKWALESLKYCRLGWQFGLPADHASQMDGPK